MDLEQVLFKKHVKEILLLLDADRRYISEIADLVDLNKSTISRILSTLEEHGLITRELEFSSAYIPKTYCSLSERGKAVVQIYSIIDKAKTIPIQIENNHGTVINEVNTSSFTINNNSKE